MPTALSDVYGTNQDDLFFRDPSTTGTGTGMTTTAADPPIWLLTGKSMGLLIIIIIIIIRINSQITVQYC